MIKEMATAMGLKLTCGACAALRTEMDRLWAVGAESFHNERPRLLKQLSANAAKLGFKLAESDLATLLDEAVRRTEAKAQ